MSDLLHTLMERVGVTKVPRYAQESVGYKAIVPYSGEFRRIENIPKRTWNNSFVNSITAFITENLKTFHGSMKLRPIQAKALYDICLYKGGFLPIGVGQGKALISLLAPLMLEASRPVLFVPAELREQTKAFVIPQMANHWLMHPNLKIIGYSELSLEKNHEMLQKINPDLIILDECDYVKRPQAGRTRRLVRWFKEHPETQCVAMSGTVASKSIKDFAHIIQWCLKNLTPVPLKWQELALWADALDEDPQNGVVNPGALKRLCANDENPRQGFRRRLVETPGVVASRESDLGVSLRIFRHNTRVPQIVYNAMSKLRNTWETPNGDIIVEAADLWRHMRELALGFWYLWNPPAPKKWLEARREWKSFVREKIKRSRKEQFDTELQVWNNCEKVGNIKEFIEWKGVKDEFKPNVVAEWISDFALQEACDWLIDGGICWTEHMAFGKKLSEYSGVPYFGASDNGILTTSNESIIASIRSHGTGKNLQRYSRNLFVAPSSSGKTWEQTLGRTHRPGQKADEVKCEVFLHAPELEKSFEQAQANAIFLEDTLGNKQKLNYADIVT